MSFIDPLSSPMNYILVGKFLDFSAELQRQIAIDLDIVDAHDPPTFSVIDQAKVWLLRAHTTGVLGRLAAIVDGRA